jgi:hypothetical protein
MTFLRLACRVARSPASGAWVPGRAPGVHAVVLADYWRCTTTVSRIPNNLPADRRRAGIHGIASSTLRLTAGKCLLSKVAACISPVKSLALATATIYYSGHG